MKTEICGVGYTISDNTLSNVHLVKYSPQGIVLERVLPLPQPSLFSFGTKERKEACEKLGLDYISEFREQPVVDILVGRFLSEGWEPFEFNVPVGGIGGGFLAPTVYLTVQWFRRQTEEQSV